MMIVETPSTGEGVVEKGGQPRRDAEVQQPLNPERVPTCGAKTGAEKLCQRPAIEGRKRCRLHGGLSPGAPRGFNNGNFKNGDWTAEAIEERKWLRSLMQLFAGGGKS
jgi:hypothetical protein